MLRLKLKTHKYVVQLNKIQSYSPCDALSILIDLQKKTVSLRTKQHIYESYITIHYQIILFFIKNINDYLNDGWLMKDVKRSAFKSSQTPWKLWKTVKTGVQASITVHLEEPIENSTEVFINYVIGLQVINFNILYQPLKFEHFTAIITTSSFCTCTPVLFC